MANSNAISDRLALRRFRAPMAAVGAAVLGLSMLLSVAPVLGAANSNNGNGSGSTPGGSGTSGNVKVRDATTGVETSGTDNEPHVCAFWLEFTFDAPFEAGTWLVVSWAPTGDGSTVASGAYDTAGDGVDSSSVIEVAAGHYRVEWAATGATSSKKKTFWVDADCDEAGSPVAEESQAEEPVTEELVLEEETVPTDDESQAQEVAPTEEEGTPPTDESVIEDVTTPTDVEDDEEPAQAPDPGWGETSTPPVQEALDGTGSSGEPTMSDTAVPAAPVQGGLLATIGLLALIVLGASLRRDRRSDRDKSAPVG